LRVSTQAQAGEDRFGKAAQLADCIPYAERAGLRVVRVYADTITGTRAHRENLERLVEEASLYEAVLISSVDRLARRVPISYAVLGELLETGLEVHSTDMGVIDLDDDSSALNFGVRSVFADADHRKIVRRLRLGRHQKVLGKDGKPGTPVVPLNGYGFEDNEILESEAKWVRWAYERALEASIYQVTRELNDLGVPGPRGGRWSDTTVKVMLRNPLYKGEYSYAKVRPGRKARPADTVRCQVPAIIDAQAWERTQRALDSRRKGKGRTGSRIALFPLMGRIKCGVCGGGMSGRKTTRRKYGTSTLEYYCHRSQRGTGQRPPPRPEASRCGAGRPWRASRRPGGAGPGDQAAHRAAPRPPPGAGTG
jgi:site-specific DNA recombinase